MLIQILVNWQEQKIAALQPRERPRVKSEPGPRTEDKGRLKKEAGHSRLVGGRFNKQGNLYKDLSRQS